jgi:hypothetical protein
VSSPSPENGKRSRFQKVKISRIPNDARSPKTLNSECGGKKQGKIN